MKLYESTHRETTRTWNLEPQFHLDVAKDLWADAQRGANPVQDSPSADFYADDDVSLVS
jgi:hypothetical protein